MKKILTNVMALAMVAGLACSTAACGTTVVEEVDENKTQLYIASYSGGGGYKWLDEAVERFEEKYATKSFEEGKTGAQIIVDHSKGYSASKSETYITSGGFDLHFVPTPYISLAKSGNLLDLTDMITETNSHDNKSIESKMNDDVKNFMKVDGKYYGLPYYDSFSSVTYDADLFKEKKLYFSNQVDDADTTYPDTNAFAVAASATLSCGPDAVYGTYDDGLPSTFQEFYKLMDKMIEQGVTPFAFTGMSDHYTNMLMNALSANYMGVDAMKTHINFNSNGKKVEIVTGFNGETPIIEPIELTEENAYLIKSSAGLYYAAEFCEKVFTDTRYYDTTAAKGSTSNIGAMECYLKSGWEPSTPTPIAMLIEGSYWYGEAESEGVIERTRKFDPSGNNGVKNVKNMPLPHQYAGSVTPKAEGEAPIAPVLAQNSAVVVADSKMPSERVSLAKLFLQFCYSDEELVKAEFSNNGIGRALTYDTSSIQDDLPTYAKSVNAMKTQAVENGTTYLHNSQHRIYLAHAEFGRATNGGYWTTSLTGADYAIVYQAFKTEKCSAKEYFEGLKITKNMWDNNYLK